MRIGIGFASAVVRGFACRSRFAPRPLFFATASSPPEPPTTTTTTAASPSPFSNSYTPPSPERLLELMPSHDADGCPYTDYEKCVRRLYLTNLFHPVKLGLQNMEALHNALGNPMDNPQRTVIHVAGTNGKGSVSLKIAKSLELAGFNVGLFVSPHVSSFRERMQMNGTPISEDQVSTYLPEIFSICEQEKIPATFFEVTTALAFRFFDKQQADVVVLETGLGGRLDATNVISRPALCVITSIGLEHTRILGDTIELIAGEKAGIIKEGTPVLVGPNVPHDVIRQHARDKRAEGYYTCEDIMGVDMLPKTYLTEDFEDYDIENSRIAKAALLMLQKKRDISFSSTAVEQGTSQRPPCRFEEMEIPLHSRTLTKRVHVILDVAHNPDAMKYLAAKLESTYPNKAKRIVVGFSADKDLSQCGETLLSIVSDPSRLHLVQASHPRAASLEEILGASPKLRNSNFDELDRSISAQVKAGLDLAAENDEILVVCGSVFLMSEAREAMGIDEPRDSKYIAEVAGCNLKNSQENFADSDPERKDVS